MFRAMLALFFLLLLSICASPLFGQSDCPLPTDLTSNVYYPFGEDVRFRVTFDSVAEFEVRVGPQGFDPESGLYDTLFIGSINSWADFGTIVWQDFPASVDYDAYARLICAVGDTSDWFGPTNFSRETTPPPCGMSMEEACEVEVMVNDSLPYFTVPDIYSNQVPVSDGDTCLYDDEFTWYRFNAPASGQVLLRGLFVFT